MNKTKTPALGSQVLDSRIKTNSKVCHPLRDCSVERKGKVEASKWGWGQAAEPVTVLRVALLEKAEKARFE